MPKASKEYCQNTDPEDMGFTQRASCKAQGYVEREDGTKRKSDKYKNEDSSIIIKEDMSVSQIPISVDTSDVDRIIETMFGFQSSSDLFNEMGIYDIQCSVFFQQRAWGINVFMYGDIPESYTEEQLEHDLDFVFNMIDKNFRVNDHYSLYITSREYEVRFTVYSK